MDILLTYDVETTTPEGARRLRQVAAACENYGQRVQKSVFECRLTLTEFEAMEASLLDIIDLDKDSLRVYFLYGPRDKAVRVYGVDLYRDFDEPLIT